MKSNELKDYIKPLIFFGEAQFTLAEIEDGFKIEVLDHESGKLIDENGKVYDKRYSSTMKKVTLYTNAVGKVTFIEHGYKAFTMANRTPVALLLTLIGKTVDINSIRKSIAQY